MRILRGFETNLNFTRDFAGSRIRISIERCACPAIDSAPDEANPGRSKNVVIVGILLLGMFL